MPAPQRSPSLSFCNACGAGPLIRSVPVGDDRPRLACGTCGHIQYENPKIVVGALPVWEDKVLLCRRAIEPRHGFWTLPAGFMEEGETLEEGAARETLEEANARIAIDALYSVISLPDISQVYVLFRARLLDLNFSAGAESLDVALFQENEIPWDNLAFLTIREALTNYFADAEHGGFVPRVTTLRRPVKTA